VGCRNRFARASWRIALLRWVPRLACVVASRRKPVFRSQRARFGFGGCALRGGLSRFHAFNARGSSQPSGRRKRVALWAQATTVIALVAPQPQRYLSAERQDCGAAA